MNTEVLKLGKYFGNQLEINNNDNNKSYLQALTPNEHDFLKLFDLHHWKDNIEILLSMSAC